MAQTVENTRLNKQNYKEMMQKTINSMVEKEKGTEFHHKIFIDYIKLKGAKNLVDFLNHSGLKFKTKYEGRKWQTTDIRNFVLNPENHHGINDDLVKIVCAMVDYTGKASFEQRLFRAMKAVLKI